MNTIEVKWYIDEKWILYRCGCIYEIFEDSIIDI